MPTITTATITDAGTAMNSVVAPARGFGSYEDSGHGAAAANAATVAAILEANGIGEASSLSGSKHRDTLPTNAQSAKTNQDIFHVHASKRDADQIFFKWAWTSDTATLAITATAPFKHK